MVYLLSQMSDKCVFSLISPLMLVIFTDLEHVLDFNFRYPKILGITDQKLQQIINFGIMYSLPVSIEKQVCHC